MLFKLNCLWSAFVNGCVSLVVVHFVSSLTVRFWYYFLTLNTFVPVALWLAAVRRSAHSCVFLYFFRVFTSNIASMLRIPLISDSELCARRSGMIASYVECRMVYALRAGSGTCLWKICNTCMLTSKPACQNVVTIMSLNSLYVRCQLSIMTLVYVTLSLLCPKLFGVRGGQ